MSIYLCVLLRLGHVHLVLALLTILCVTLFKRFRQTQLAISSIRTLAIAMNHQMGVRVSPKQRVCEGITDWVRSRESGRELLTGLGGNWDYLKCCGLTYRDRKWIVLIVDVDVGVDVDVDVGVGVDVDVGVGVGVW